MADRPPRVWTRKPAPKPEAKPDIEPRKRIEVEQREAAARLNDAMKAWHAIKESIDGGS